MVFIEILNNASNREILLKFCAKFNPKHMMEFHVKNANITSISQHKIDNVTYDSIYLLREILSKVLGFTTLFVPVKR